MKQVAAVMPLSSAKKKPIWLEKRWQERKQETVGRVKNAIEALVKAKISVSIRTICALVQEQTGHSLSPNTIKQNSEAYELYQQFASRRPTLRLKDSALLELLNECPDAKRLALQAKVNRLKHISKDDLIARLIRLEKELQTSKTIENKIRERLIELEIYNHKKKES